MYAPQKFQGFFQSSQARNTFQTREGNQRPGALTGSISNFKSTIITVYEVVHQKTDNTKLGKHTIWFSEVIKEFYHYFQEK